MTDGPLPSLEFDPLECVKVILPTVNPQQDNAHALRLAAAGRHADCVRLLLAAQAFLPELQDVFSFALDDGHADIVAVMLDCQPLLFAREDLSRRKAVAEAHGHAELAALLSAVIEQRSLLNAALAPAARSATPAPRL